MVEGRGERVDMSSEVMREELEEELKQLIISENEIDNELSEYFNIIAEGKSVSTGLSYETSADLSHSLSKIEQFAPSFEVMTQSSSKLVNQIDECRSLSDRLSMMVRRLDLIQVRAQEALACTEDVINMKDCKAGILKAIDEHNLPLAVSFIKQVHDIDIRAVKASDDYGAIEEAEKKVCNLVRAEFESAMQSSNIDMVLKLCPLLQTVGLEVEARDSFLSFIEDNIFISISADAADIDATDHATAYAQTLASIFNNAYLIYQRYLPIVIQGMEKSDGDVMFIRRLHAKCSKESGLVLKRYMKFRNVKASVAAAIASSAVLSHKSTGRLGNGNIATHPDQALLSPAEMHQMLDEIAIILQYCCLYGQYVDMLCKGAEDRPREHHDPSNNKLRVFNGPSDFDQMTDELINSYYVEAEHWLMLWGIECITKAVKGEVATNKSDTENKIESTFENDTADSAGDFDGCFFVLQRCAQRAIATNNINAACAVLHFMTDHLSNDLLQYLTQELHIIVNGVLAYIKEVMRNLLKVESDVAGGVKLSGIAKGFQNVFTGRRGIGSEPNEDQETVENAEMVSSMELFNAVETCVRYTAGLRKEIEKSSREVFGIDANNSNGDKVSIAATNKLAKINMSLDNFDECKDCFSQAINNAVSDLAAGCEVLMMDILDRVLGEIDFSYDGDRFDAQEAVQMVPKVLVDPFEVLLRISTDFLNDANKDVVVGMLCAAYSSSIEKYISEVR